MKSIYKYETQRYPSFPDEGYYWGCIVHFNRQSFHGGVSPAQADEQFGPSKWLAEHKARQEAQKMQKEALKELP